MATLDADAKRISKAADRLAKRSERLEKAVAKAGQTVGDAESSRARSRLERAVADARGLLAGSTADQYKVPYLYRRLGQLTEQAAGLLDDGSASCLLTFGLCRAATRRDMLEARWREESAGSVGEESHESA